MVSLRLQTNWTSYADDVVSRARALRFLGGFACGARVRFGCLRRVDFLGLRALVWRVLCFFLLFLCGSWRGLLCLLRLRCARALSLSLSLSLALSLSLVCSALALVSP